MPRIPRLADLPSGLRYLVIALLILLVILILRWVDQEDPAPKFAQDAHLTPIHFKLRAGAMHSLHMGERPLFRHHAEMRLSIADSRDLWMRIEVPASQVQPVLAQLALDPLIEEAFVPPTVTLASVMPRPLAASGDASCPITTPSFESYQGYLGPAPHGIDAPAVWRRGIRGQDVWFADVEGGWNARHEDLPGDRIVHAGGMRIDDEYWRAHGTAVLGEVVGRDNGKGVVGIAPDVDKVFTSSLGGTSVADALDTAADSLRPGDVMLIELQGAGPRGRYLPVEYWDDNYEAIATATARGVIVVEAAGNGAEDLDHEAYRGKLERAVRDSGAIVVGAGGPPREGFDDRARLDFSNYGSRVDVQGWGRKVATLDYGDLQRCAGADRHYTGEFAGTSSASPIVAGAAVLLQSYAKAKGVTLMPVEIREMLRATGTPQTSDPKEQIGPRPDLSRAIDAFDRGHGEVYK